jgi:hypothetical protein
MGTRATPLSIGPGLKILYGVVRVCTALFIGAMVLPAATAAVTINFDDAPPFADVSTRYAAQGVVIESLCDPGGGRPPEALPDPDARTSPNIATAACFEGSGAAGFKFPTGRHLVSVYARPSRTAGDYLIEAYGTDGTLIAAERRAASLTDWTELAVRAPGGDETIRSVAVEPTTGQMGPIDLDDLTFLGSPPAPDTTPPMVDLQAPAPNAHVSARESIAATVADDVGVAGWCATANTSSTPPPDRCNRPVSGLSPHAVGLRLDELVDPADEGKAIVIAVHAYDFAGNVGTAGRIIRFRNLPNLFVRGIEVAQAYSPPFRYQHSDPFMDGVVDWRDPLVTVGNRASDAGRPGFGALAAGRPTVLRIYGGVANTGYSHEQVTALISATRNGELLPGAPLLVQGGDFAAAYDNPYANQLCCANRPDRTINAVLPNAWTHGVVQLRVDLNHGGQIPECQGCHGPGNALTLRGVRFRPTGRLVIRPVRIRWTGHWRRPECERRPKPPSCTENFLPADNDRVPVWDRAAKLLPIARDQIRVRDWVSTVSVGGGRCWELLARFQVWAFFQGGGGHFVGHLPHLGLRQTLFKNAYSRDCVGIGSYPNPLTGEPGKTLLFSTRYDRVLAHELGHNFGLGHSEPEAGITGTGYDVTAADRYYNNYDFEPTPTHPFYVVDPGAPPFHVFDLMTPSHTGAAPNWPSGPTWNRFLAAFSRLPGATARHAARPLGSGATHSHRGDAIVVAGRVDRYGRAHLGAVLRGAAQLSATSAPRRRQTYVLRTRDSNGRVLDSVPVPMARLADAAKGDPTPFVVALPRRRDIAEISLMRNGAAVARRRRSRSAPRIRLRGPHLKRRLSRRRPLTLKWNAHDQDGDRLTYTVQYRTGKQPWRLLDFADSANRYTIARGAVPRSRRLQLRVVANDGLRQAAATTPPRQVR